VLSEEARAVGDCLKRGRKVCRSHVPQGAGQLLGKLESAKDGIYRNAHLAPLLDCFNQMGNIRFLRSQREAAADISRMRAAYEEYFASVQEALDRIEAVLPRLDAELQSTIPPGQERRYVQGQRPVRTERADPL